ncbi:MAG: hypothetical protein VYD19_04805, partial [Myxococcota bacterium]|nr:hypothetical protein [Myxococcota bacterium]
VCVECSGFCSDGDICSDGGFCMEEVAIGGEGNIAIHQLFDVVTECFSTHRGTQQIEGCAKVRLNPVLEGPDGAPVDSLQRADESEEYACSDEARDNWDGDVRLLRELFGCGLFDIWNIWWMNDFLAGQEFCVYYVPRKTGFSLPVVTRNEVVVLDRCDLSTIE